MIHSRIERALNDAIKLHNTGLSANDSLIKSASLHELNPETISRVCEAFNIAKTRAYVKLASDPAGEFETADKSKVINGVFGEAPVEKTASFEPGKATATLKFGSDKKFTFGTRQVEDKTASVREFTSTASVEDQLKLAYHAIDSHKREISQKRAELVDYRHNFENAFYRAQDYLSYTDNRDKLGELVLDIDYQYENDKVAEKLIDLVLNTYGVQVDREKVAGARPYGSDTFHQIFDDLHDAATRYGSLAPIYNQTVEDKTAEIADLTGSIRKLAGVQEDNSASSFVGGKPMKKVASLELMPVSLIAEFETALFGDNEKVAEKKTEGASKFIKTAFGIGFKGVEVGLPSELQGAQSGMETGIKDLVGKGYQLRLRGIDPKQKAEQKVNMDQIQRESILRDLVSNDEIISQQDPKSIESAYNTMLALAPSASMVPDVVRSVLRQATAQSIDPHFANQLVELENNIMKSRQDNTAPQKN